MEDEPRPDPIEPEDVPEPTPGLTAPLDDVTEEEQRLRPVAPEPGAGPDADAAEHRPEDHRADRDDEDLED